MQRCLQILGAVLMLLPVSLLAIDHLDLITSMEGEFEGCQFGNAMISMDYNGDGYDDLIVQSSYWNPNGTYDSTLKWGKLYFYWGGPGFDNVADVVIVGNHNRQFQSSCIINAGDVNGDSIDDLALATYPYEVAIYYGSPNPTGIPDLTISVLYTLDQFLYPSALGDINGDGHDDLALFISPMTGNDRIKIWTGNSQQTYLLAETTNQNVYFTCSGVGDVNADGYADYILQHGISGGTNLNNRIVLYYGNPSFPQADSLVITDDSNQVLGTRRGYSVGDINHDGYGDFTAYNGRIWYGGEDISVTNNAAITYYASYHPWTSLCDNNGVELVFGDLNDDGYDDIIGSASDTGYYDGEVGIWLGSPNMNGVCDLYLHPPVDYRTCQFGWAKAAGDFNADGICDLAVSAPEFYAVPRVTGGRVYVYGGDAQWVSNIDPINPEPAPNPWQVELHPNPLRQRSAMGISFTGTGYKSRDKVSVEIYNLKGQKLSQIQKVSPDAELTLPENLTSYLSSGIYLISIREGNKTLYSKKICVIK